MDALLLAAHLLLATVPTEAPQPPAQDVVTFRLYKFQQPIGIERSLVDHNADGTTDVRMVFTFTDRNTPVPLAATATFGSDGAARRFAVWGSTSRPSRVDDRVEISAGRVTIDQSGVRRSEAAPHDFFVGSAYAPIYLTELLWRYWSTHGRPRSLRLYPSGEAILELRGAESVKSDDGRTQKLDRYSLKGRGWGLETFWIDADGHLAAYKGVDTEFDHFEAIRRDFSEALGSFVASAASDGIAALAEESQRSTAGPSDAKPVAYVGATLIDGTGKPPVPDAVVVVERDRIVAAGPRNRVTIPAGARRISVTGKTIVPGLWDMHAHFEQVEWGPVYLASGVTTVRDCGNELDFIRGVRDTIDAGRGLGPRILLACIVDGDGPSSIGTTRIRTEKDIPDLIRRFQEARCSQVKIYSSLDPRLIAPLAKAAHAAGLTVTGHIPEGIGAVHAVEAGMDQINHVSYIVRALLPGEDPDARLPAPAYMRALAKLDTRSESSRTTLALLASRGIVVDPTLALYELWSKTHAEITTLEPGLAKVAPALRPGLDTMSISPDREADGALSFKTNLATLRALHEAGVPIVAGTDQAVPGHSLHRELEIYVSAGFTPMEAIQAATIVPARAMHKEHDLGTVEPGQIADLVVVDGDPLADIRNLRKVVTVVRSGRAYDPAPLWRMVGFQP